MTHWHFVTGRLAAPALRDVAARVATAGGFAYSIQVLPITVAALLSPPWIAKRIECPPETTAVLLPGYVTGDLTPVEQASGRPVHVGPRDLRALPEFFGQSPHRERYGAYDIEILAEINHAPRLPVQEILAVADRLRADGADLIDVGCEPGEPWGGVGDCVRALRDAGHRVSIDSLDPREIEPAVRAGAERVLSVNSTNINAALDWGVDCVVVPDDFPTLAGLEETAGRLADAGVQVHLDPVLEPIGFGFAASLGRYLEVRRRFPDAEMMMGTGNLTELTDVDSAGVNVLLLGFCQELGVRSVLTTQVIPWAQSSVRECDLGRRLVGHAVAERVLPKHLEPGLVCLRDSQRYPQTVAELDALAAEIKDHNYRIFAEEGEVHLLGNRRRLSNPDPFVLFEKLIATGPKNVDAGHAFYLGYEMAKAATALTLGKQYRQDEALDWGHLTRPERSRQERRRALEDEGRGEDA